MPSSMTMIHIITVRLNYFLLLKKQVVSLLRFHNLFNIFDDSVPRQCPLCNKPLLLLSLDVVYVPPLLF